MENALLLRVHNLYYTSPDEPYRTAELDEAFDKAYTLLGGEYVYDPTGFHRVVRAAAYATMSDGQLADADRFYILGHWQRCRDSAEKVVAAGSIAATYIASQAPTWEGSMADLVTIACDLVSK